MVFHFAMPLIFALSPDRETKPTSSSSVENILGSLEKNLYDNNVSSVLRRAVAHMAQECMFFSSTFLDSLVYMCQFRIFRLPKMYITMVSRISNKQVLLLSVTVL